MKVELIDYTKDGERLVALAAKRSISKKPVEKIELSEEEIEKWILETFRRQHWSPWEFSWYMFEVECSRVCTHQLVRHRIASYVQMSQRHSIHMLKTLLRNVGSKVNLNCSNNDYMCLALAIEEFEKKLAETKGNPVAETELFDLVEETFHIPYSVKSDREVYREYVRYLLALSKFYLVMVNKGIKYEDARYTLPQAIKSRILVAMNARELATSFLPLRMCARAQAEIREVAWKLWHKLVKVHPKLFKYVGPRCLMMENSVREKPVGLRELLKEDSNVEFTITRCPELVPRNAIRTCIINTYKSTFNLRY